jgi:alkanesulfonate monooxygenase SsuD/methylene tetrahydromethanopterin reductase-like flavin-dependent oxidoreductase (luciferase family)
MRYGVSVPNMGDLDALVEMGVEADRAGWDGFFVWDQIRLMADAPVRLFDPWVLLAAIAVRTERVRIGTLITPIARRRPWKLARETVTLDHLSAGRLILGVGLGYPSDADFALLGEDPDDRVRAAKLDEGLEVLTRLWTAEPVDFDGDHFHVHGTRFDPGPVQRPRIPIWVGGMWPNRAPFRRAGRFDGVVPIKVDEAGMPANLAPSELADVVAYVSRHRTSGEPFDVVHGGRVDPAVLAASAAAGATWYLADAGVEGPGWEEPTLEMIRSGSPSD